MKRTKNLILYKNFEHAKLFDDFIWVMEEYQNQYQDVESPPHVIRRKVTEDLRTQYFNCLNQLVELSVSHGFEGNLWHCFLAYILVNHENAYSTACELRDEVEGTINQVAMHDFTIMKDLFEFDFQEMLTGLEINEWNIIAEFQNINSNSRVFNQRIRDRICELAVRLKQAETVAEFKDIVTAFYRDFGVGKFGLHKAFRIVHTKDGKVDVEPITRVAHVHLDDLVGYEIAKKKLIDNTEAFIRGKEANNCLLYGDAGTGKSTSIKAIVNQYYESGLRLIEIYKHQFQDFQTILTMIKNRNYKFIIYMDDLSFEEFEIEYKYLKAVIEGGLEKKPENVLIYATSNRRHLIRENYSDKFPSNNVRGTFREEGIREDMHTSDTVQEKLSLVARFGVTIYFGSPEKKEFQEIVRVLAKRYQVKMAEEELLAEANKWELYHGGLSGRTAQQFINYLLGRQDSFRRTK